MHAFPRTSFRRVGPFERCACCDRTHTGYVVGNHLELGWCDDHEDDVVEIVDFLDATWIKRKSVTLP